MDLLKVLAELHIELEDLDAAILSLERLQHEGRRRGRPPRLLAEMKRSGLPTIAGKQLALPKTRNVKGTP